MHFLRSYNNEPKLKFSNENRTEINLPLQDGLLKTTGFVSIGVGSCNFGNLDINYFLDKDNINDPNFNSKFLGTCEISVNMKGIDTNLDIRSIMISNIESQIKNEESRHIKEINFFKSELSKLKCIEYKE